MQSLRARALILQAALQRKEDSEPPPSYQPREKLVVEEEWQAQLEVLEAEFRQEAAEPNWSLARSEALRATLRGGDSTGGEWVKGIECRSRTCRVEVFEAGTVGLDLPILLAQVQERLPSFVSGLKDVPNGERAIVLYMSRDVADPSVAHGAGPH